MRPKLVRLSLSMLVLLLLLSFFPGSSVGWLLPIPERAVDESLSSVELEKHLRFLASDELQGRMTGSQGERAAARYIAEHFRAVGLRPPPGQTDYYQPVPLVKATSPGAQKVVIAERSLEQGNEFLLIHGQDFELTAPLAWAGDGLEKRSEGQAPDLTGKIAVVKVGSIDGAGRFDHILRKMKLLKQRGALAVLELYSGISWSRIAADLNRPRYLLKASVQETIPYFLVTQQGAGFQEAALGDLPDTQATLAAGARVVEDLQTSNVVGILPGHDPRLKDQWIALTAHFDHVGADPNRPGATRDDWIFNGARDNGVGTTSLLGAATALAKDPPARSVVFIAFTGEEIGLLGSSYYVENPAVPLEQTVFALNNDGAGYSDTSAVTVLGLTRTTAADEIRAACRRFGLEVIVGDQTSQLQRFFNQSDNLVFARRGVPAPTFSPGFRALSELKYYHRPTDEADENFDFAYLHRFAQAYALAARLIADRPEVPRWTAGDQYEEAARTLYRDFSSRP